VSVLDSYGQHRAEELMIEHELNIRPVLESLELFGFDEVVDWLWGSEVYRSEIPEALQSKVAGMVASAMVVAVLQDRCDRGDTE
jgi:hypothetical protein